jgi:hypothetical protein
MGRPGASVATFRTSSSSGGGLSMRFPSLRAPARAALSTSTLAEAVEETLQCEGVAVTYQYTCLRAAISAEYTNEILQASAAIRRQRRRALIRLLRKSRLLTSNSLSALQDSPPAQLLASIGASVNSLSSGDEESMAPARSVSSSNSSKACKRYRAAGKERGRRRRSSSSSNDSDMAWGSNTGRCYGCVYATCKCAAQVE